MSSLNHSLLAAAMGITSCTVFFAMNTTLNYIALPCYLLPPQSQSESKQGANDDNTDPEASKDLILRQWETTYAIGHFVGPGSCIFSTLAFLYAAQTLPVDSVDLKSVYYFAAACAAMAVPFTVVYLLPTNDELDRRAGLLRDGPKTRIPGKEEQSTAKTNTVQRKGKGKSEPAIQGVDTLTLIRKCLFLSKIRALMPLPAVMLRFMLLPGHERR